MEKPYQKSLFIFHRDLRLQDNTGLTECSKQSEKIIPIFIYDPQQITSKNKYFSANAVQFMQESLTDLKKQLRAKKGRLFEFYGNTADLVKNLIENKTVDAVFFNKDYTPFALKRDKDIETICKKNNIAYHSFHDELLQAPDTVETKQKTPYTIFTPFFNTSKKITVKKPQNLPSASFFKGALKSSYKKLPPLKFPKNKNIAEHGGTNEAKKILRSIKDFKNYNKERNFPALDATTKLSAHNKFGTVSIREAYYTIKDVLTLKNDLIKELYWRDFFTQLAYHSPRIFKEPFREKYKNIKWKNNKTWFKKWCEGETGFPIVDAGMRELNTTGFMHNRVRMIVASFLVKDLHINWQWGEKYFAQKLVDYDPSVNNGNWQWAASTGADAQPYFRIFNPWLQQKKYDKDCIYIKKWIPELKNIPAKDINNWLKTNVNHNAKYPKPIVDHAKQTKITKTLYKK